MNKLKTNPSVGDLRVWWCPQIPMTRFFVDVLDIFNDASDNEDFEARIAQIVIDAHKSGNKDATKLLVEMAVSFGEQKV